MNTKKLRDMNLHAVADELEQLRAFKAEVESQEPAGRITEQDVREIINTYTDNKNVFPVNEWLEPLLNKLNADRQVPAVAVPDEWRESLKEMVQAMRDYEMDVGEQAPEKHRRMMDTAEALLAASSHSQKNDPIPWIPVLKNRADGVDGHYAIGRYNPSGYWEFWNLLSHKWASASNKVLSLNEANDLLSRLVIPSRESQQSTDVEGFKLIPVLPYGFDLRAYNRHTGEWMYLNHADTWQLFQGPIKQPHIQQSAKSGYAGVTVWVGDKTNTQIVSRLEIETSSADELLRRFENARHLLSQSERCPSHESEQGSE